MIELIRANPEQIQAVRDHLQSVHADYVAAFERLLTRAWEQQDR